MFLTTRVGKLLAMRLVVVDIRLKDVARFERLLETPLVKLRGAGQFLGEPKYRGLRGARM